MNLSFRMQKAFTHRKIKPLSDELLDILLRSAEAMQNPGLLLLVLFPQGDNFVMASHIV